MTGFKLPRGRFNLSPYPIASFMFSQEHARYTPPTESSWRKIFELKDLLSMLALLMKNWGGGGLTFMSPPPHMVPQILIQLLRIHFILLLSESVLEVFSQLIFFLCSTKCGPVRYLLTLSLIIVAFCSLNFTIRHLTLQSSYLAK